jgi:hypothetical protein
VCWPKRGAPIAQSTLTQIQGPVPDTVWSSEAALSPADICSLDPGLGVMNTFSENGISGIFWDNNRDGVVDFAAFSYEGDNTVDAVFVNNSRGELTWVAHCPTRGERIPATTHLSSEDPGDYEWGPAFWINYPEYAQAHQQPVTQPERTEPTRQTQTQQPQQGPMTAPSPLVSGELQDLGEIQDGAGTESLIWVDPAPYVGEIQPNYGQCNEDYSSCETVDSGT